MHGLPLLDRGCHRKSDALTTVGTDCHAVLHRKTEPNRQVTFADSSLQLCLNVFLFLSHHSGPSLPPLLDVPLLGNLLGNLFFLQLFDDVLASLLVSGEDLWAHVHLQLLLGNVVDRVPQLCIRLQKQHLTLTQEQQLLN